MRLSEEVRRTESRIGAGRVSAERGGQACETGAMWLAFQPGNRAAFSHLEWLRGFLAGLPVQNHCLETLRHVERMCDFTSNPLKFLS